MLLDSREQVRDFCRTVAGSPFVAVDTEFQWDRTYFAHLALVQLATPEHVALIDCTVVDDLSPLASLVCETETIKVFHSASQDLSILGRVLGRPVANIYDTQIADALLGGAHQVSYAKLVAAYLAIDIDKSAQRTDWLKRPLSAPQLEYASGDVIHLAEIYPTQVARLEAMGRLAWAQEDSAWLAANPPSEATDPESAYTDIAGWGRLDPRQLHNLMRLARWREHHCRDNNIRPRWLIPDQILLACACRGRFQKGVPAEVKPWIARRAEKLAGQIDEVLAEAARIPDADLPECVKHRRPTPLEKRLVDLADKTITARAKELGIEKMLLASRSDFTALVRHMLHRGEAPEDARLLNGWRRGQIGMQLLDLIPPLCQQD